MHSDSTPNQKLSQAVNENLDLRSFKNVQFVFMFLGNKLSQFETCQ